MPPLLLLALPGSRDDAEGEVGGWRYLAGLIFFLAGDRDNLSAREGPEKIRHCLLLNQVRRYIVRCHFFKHRT